MKRFRGRSGTLAGGVAGALLLCLGAACAPENRFETDPPVGEARLLRFAVDPEAFVSVDGSFRFPPHTPLSEVLDGLGRELSEGYFRGEGGGVVPIRFETRSIVRIPAGPHDLRLATIDMIDPGGNGLGFYFQGSTGAQCSFYLIACTFLQPQRDPPLLDGILLLYNGDRFPVMDHVQLQEIVVPGRVRPVVDRAVFLADGEIVG